MLQVTQQDPIAASALILAWGALTILVLGFSRLLLVAVGVRVLRRLKLSDDLIEKYTLAVLRPFRRDRPK